MRAALSVVPRADPWRPDFGQGGTEDSGPRADKIGIKAILILVAVLAGLSLRAGAAEVAPISSAECNRLRSLPVVRIVVERGSVEAVLAQLEKSAGFRLVIAPNQTFISPISFYATGTPWDVMDNLQATDTVTFTLERGTWVVRSPESSYLRTYSLERIRETRHAEIRQEIAKFLEGDPAAQVSYAPDRRSITVAAKGDFHFKVGNFLRQLDSTVRTTTPLMVAVDRPGATEAGHLTLKDMPANAKVAR